MRTNFPAITVLIVLLVLIYLGFLERVLERMRLSRTQAIFILLAMLLGGSLPEIPLGMGLKINLGGMAIPLIVVLYLLATADGKGERLRALMATIVTVIVVWSADRLFFLRTPMNFF